MTNNYKIHICTLGCAKNEVDSDIMAAKLETAGYIICSDSCDAHLIIINTCAFLESAVEEGLDIIFDFIKFNSKAKIIVCGCMPSRYGSDLSSSLPEVNKFLSVAEEDNIVSEVDKLLVHESISQITPYKRRNNDPYAYVKISDGCNRFCSYCMIPYIRGRYHSYSMAYILTEVDELVKKGTKEIIFIGQDTGIWGTDFVVPSSLEELLKTASDTFPDVWFRVLYIQPEGINDSLLELIAQRPNICSYLDIPIQHVDSDLLKKMNRTGSFDSLKQLIKHIRELIPDVSLRTTCMVGFPSETQKQFDSLVQFLSDIKFDYAGVFSYSQEEGSAAAKFKDQIDEDIKLQRAQLLSDVSEQIGFKRKTDLIGKTFPVLIESLEITDEGLEALGRFQGQAPDVDGQVHILCKNSPKMNIGDICMVHISDSFCYELVGEVCEKCQD